MVISSAISVSSMRESASVVDDEGEEVEVIVTVLSAGPMDLQIGANEGQMMEVRVPEVSTKTLGVDMVNVGTQDGACRAIEQCDVAIDMVSAIRAKLGAYENSNPFRSVTVKTLPEPETVAVRLKPSSPISAFASTPWALIPLPSPKPSQSRSSSLSQ